MICPDDLRFPHGEFQDLVTPAEWEVFQRIPGIMGRWKYAYYLHRYASLVPAHGRIVEVGTFYGGSSSVMAHALRGRDGLVITVDPSLLTPEERMRRATELAEYDTIQLGGPRSMNSVAGNLRSLGLDGYVTAVPDTSLALLKRWDGRKIDMLYVDGAHTYPGVEIDCGWMDHVKPGGFAVFDDWLAEVEAAVRDYLKTHPEWEIVTQSTDQPPGHEWLTTLVKKGGSQ